MAVLYGVWCFLQTLASEGVNVLNRSVQTDMEMGDFEAASEWSENWASLPTEPGFTPDYALSDQALWIRMGWWLDSSAALAWICFVAVLLV